MILTSLIIFISCFYIAAEAEKIGEERNYVKTVTLRDEYQYGLNSAFPVHFLTRIAAKDIKSTSAGLKALGGAAGKDPVVTQLEESEFESLEKELCLALEINLLEFQDGRQSSFKMQCQIQKSELVSSTATDVKYLTIHHYFEPRSTNTLTFSAQDENAS